MTDALHRADLAARRLALTELDRTLLVEAGAGSGKTSVLAGRVTSLLAAGRFPGSIAAITFTELAAGELRQRVSQFVTEVAGGRVRPDLRAAFPNGPTIAQRNALIQAAASLDQLVCTTIDGFCQILLTPYPVEAAMDPGAAIMDQAAGDEMFQDLSQNWFRERLSGEQSSDDVLVALFVNDPGKTETLLNTIARCMRQHRLARVTDQPRHDDPLEGLRMAVAAFDRFLAQASCREPETLTIVTELKELVAAAPPPRGPEATALLHLLDLSAPPACAIGGGGYGAYRKAGKWQAAAKAAKSTMAADTLNAWASECYEACKDAHLAAKSYAAARILHILSADLREILVRFERAKRDAALIDFDDLLSKTQGLLATQSLVKSALGQRFSTVLVDEFQDTDPVQCEILWRLCGDAPYADAPWQDYVIRPGALFLVGDPKQAIYRFRGADVACYKDARGRLLAADAHARVVIGQNFRSVRAILDWVNAHFAGPLGHPSQPGFEALFTQIEAADGLLSVASLAIAVPDGGKADAIRDAEAEAVAAFCARIIGSLLVRDEAGPRPCRPDDIALLAPGGNDLWRYERALEAQGISVSTQAGKGFYRRQEVQDLIALTRVLADPRDTLALGALLRGPLVGLTEEQILDAVAGLPVDDEATGRLHLWTPIVDLSPPLLRETIEILQTLARHAGQTTPYVLLCQAVEELQVRPLLRQRQVRTAERALANLDLYLESARAYDVRGLRAFAVAMRLQWADAQRAIEGRPDTEQHSVSLVTMHSSKGLEWPVVVPINTGTRVMSSIEATLDAHGVLHMPILGHYGPGSRDALDAERAELDFERHRLWYVATTRARDLLMLPLLSCGVPKGSWMDAFPLAVEELPPFDLESLETLELQRTDDAVNEQDSAQFRVEAALIAARTDRIKRITPHLSEAGDEVPSDTARIAPDAGDEKVASPLPRGSLARGLILHKLLEEVLTGETLEMEAVLQQRAAELACDLVDTPGVLDFEAKEASLIICRALALPEIRAVRDRLVPECWVARSIVVGDVEEVTVGVADALAVEPNGTISLVVDWKSDVFPTTATIARYRSQLRAYLQATDAVKGLIVFLSSGACEKIDRTSLH